MNRTAKPDAPSRIWRSFAIPPSVGATAVETVKNEPALKYRSLPKLAGSGPPRWEESAQCSPAKPRITPALRNPSTNRRPRGPKNPSIVSAPTRERRDATARHGRQTTTKNCRATRGSRFTRRGRRKVMKNSASITTISATLRIPTTTRIGRGGAQFSGLVVACSDQRRPGKTGRRGDGPQGLSVSPAEDVSLALPEPPGPPRRVRVRGDGRPGLVGGVRDRGRVARAPRRSGAARDHDGRGAGGDRPRLAQLPPALRQVPGGRWRRRRDGHRVRRGVGLSAARIADRRLHADDHDQRGRRGVGDHRLPARAGVDPRLARPHPPL